MSTTQAVDLARAEKRVNLFVGNTSSGVITFANQDLGITPVKLRITGSLNKTTTFAQTVDYVGHSANLEVTNLSYSNGVITFTAGEQNVTWNDNGLTFGDRYSFMQNNAGKISTGNGDNAVPIYISKIEALYV